MPFPISNGLLWRPRLGGRGRAFVLFGDRCKKGDLEAKSSPVSVATGQGFQARRSRQAKHPISIESTRSASFYAIRQPAMVSVHREAEGSHLAGHLRVMFKKKWHVWRLRCSHRPLFRTSELQFLAPRPPINSGVCLRILDCKKTQRS